MKIKSLIIIIGSLVTLGVILAFSATYFGIQSYSTAMRESILELEFGEDIITVLITDETPYGPASQEWTTIPIHELVKAHDRLPETSSDDCIIAGSILSETVKAGTYIMQNDEKEFWYTIGGSEDQIIAVFTIFSTLSLRRFSNFANALSRSEISRKHFARTMGLISDQFC